MSNYVESEIQKFRYVNTGDFSQTQKTNSDGPDRKLLCLRQKLFFFFNCATEQMEKCRKLKFGERNF